MGPARETTGRAGQRSVGSGSLKQVKSTSARAECGREPSRHRIAKPSVMLKFMAKHEGHSLNLSMLYVVVML